MKKNGIRRPAPRASEATQDVPSRRVQIPVAARPRIELLREQIRNLDERLGALRQRHALVRADLEKVLDQERTSLRQLAECEGSAKRDLDSRLSAITERRIGTEREAKALAIAIGDVEEERRRVYPEFDQLQNEQHHAEHKRKIEDLRLAHERALQYERQCDRALAEAREKTNRSYFDWRALIDQEAVTEQLASMDRLKAEWQRNSGPNIS